MTATPATHLAADSPPIRSTALIYAAVLVGVLGALWLAGDGRRLPFCDLSHYRAGLVVDRAGVVA